MEQVAVANADSTIHHDNTVAGECCDEVRGEINVDNFADHSVLMWAEANTDLVCNSLEAMASLQEAAVFPTCL